MRPVRSGAGGARIRAGGRQWNGIEPVWPRVRRRGAGTGEEQIGAESVAECERRTRNLELVSVFLSMVLFVLELGHRLILPILRVELPSGGDVVRTCLFRADG